MRSRIARAQRGMSMIELMIGMALSTLLILGLIEIFGSTRGAFAASEGLARVQENSRFAMEFLKRDIRMGGQFGCLNEFGHVGTPLRFYHHNLNAGVTAFETVDHEVRIDRPIEVYDFAGTDTGDAFTIAAGAPVVANTAGLWTPALPARLLAGLGGNAIRGSDVIVVRFFDEVPITLQGPIDPFLGDVTLTPGDFAAATVNGLYGITNCKEASLFQIQAPRGGAPANSYGSTSTATNAFNKLRLAVPPDPALHWSPRELYSLGSLLYRYRVSVFFVGVGSNGAPSLFRTQLRANPAIGNAAQYGAPEELVEGVENMQVLLGLVGATAPRVDVTTQYMSATDLLAGATAENDIRQRFARVISMRVSTLMRSPQVAAVGNPTSPTVVVGDVTITPPTDGNLRHVYDSSIVLRNRVRN